MRGTYREQLDNFAGDLVIMCDIVGEIMADGSTALLHGSLESAETALARSDRLAEVRTRCDGVAVELLARESPVATDLRQIISSIHIVDDLDRMGGLAMHIARTARRRHPERVLPAEVAEQFDTLVSLTRDMTGQVRDLLIVPDADIAVTLDQEDETIDALNDQLLTAMTQQDWPHTTRQAVDTALLLRFYERYGDHCVSVATSIVYLTTGLRSEEYLARRSRDEADDGLQGRIEAFERQIRLA